MLFGKLLKTNKKKTKVVAKVQSKKNKPVSKKATSKKKTPLKEKATSKEKVETKNNLSASLARSPQYSTQWDLLMSLYRTIPFNPLSEKAEFALKTMLDSLQSFNISDALEKTYTDKDLKRLKKYATDEFQTMGSVNRSRLKSLIDLSDEELHQTIFESFFLYHINPAANRILKIEESKGFDEDGIPITKTHPYEVFPKDALYGIDGLLRFFPKNLGEPSEVMQKFIQNTYPSLKPEFEKQFDPSITALTTIGSLGGIGHKPDSDMDLQVIFNTEPQFNYRWNDADFFLALIIAIFQNVYIAFWNSILSEKHRNSIKNKAILGLQNQFEEALKPEELKIVHQIFPSAYQERVRILSWIFFQKMSVPQQSTLLWRQIKQTIQQYPHFEKYQNQLRIFFPFLQKIPIEKFHLTCFPYSTKNVNRAKLIAWLVSYYRNQHLGKNVSQQILEKAAKKVGVTPEQIPIEKQQLFFMEALTQAKNRDQILLSFLADLILQTSFEGMKHMPQMLDILKQEFDPSSESFHKGLLNDLLPMGNEKFRSKMVTLIDEHFNWHALKVEAESEFGSYRKILRAESYITRKYPHTEVHYFKNILRKQRQGQHTPFLVSPEGSMAYSTMLNDFLLNPAVILAGTTPMPFELPHEFKILCRTGVLSANQWTLPQTATDGTTENIAMQQLADWGPIDIPREKFWEHAIPIYLRESEKVSHLNLPKALLNCWWVEMICCLEDDDAPLTSLTRLLWNPEDRYFIKHDVEHELADALKTIESEYPQLIFDPWWIKFSEMLLRYTDANIRKHMIFCFAQHIRLSDIIDFNNEAKPIWVDKHDKSIPWRTWALIRFYDLFFIDKGDRIDLMRFTQGRDDIGNTMERRLKDLFVESMKWVEQKLLNINQQRSLEAVSKYIFSMGISIEKKQVDQYLIPLLKIINQKLLIADPTILDKFEAGSPLGAIEKMQLEELQVAQKKISQVVTDIVLYFEQFDLKLSEKRLQQCILNSKIKIAGDPLENFLFKYHFERNFHRKPYQIQLPIAKSLSIPRKQILISFNKEVNRWEFQSVLSKKDIGRVGFSVSGSKPESKMDMFQEHLVQGVARCVFSGYAGFSARNLTSFQKPAVRSNSPIANNPVTGLDLETLAYDIHQFFSPFVVSSYEMLENIYYIRDIFMVSNVNNFNVISLIVRDNFNEQFVIDFNIGGIQVQVNPKMLVSGSSEKFPRFFQQLHSKECRYIFMKKLGELNIPLVTSYRPNFKIWMNIGNFKLPIAPKLCRTYLEGIAHALWPPHSIGTSLFLHPQKLERSFDFLGREAIQKAQNSPPDNTR